MCALNILCLFVSNGSKENSLLSQEYRLRVEFIFVRSVRTHLPK